MSFFENRVPLSRPDVSKIKSSVSNALPILSDNGINVSNVQLLNSVSSALGYKSWSEIKRVVTKDQLGTTGLFHLQFCSIDICKYLNNQKVEFDLFCQVMDRALFNVNSLADIGINERLQEVSESAYYTYVTLNENGYSLSDVRSPDDILNRAATVNVSSQEAKEIGLTEVSTHIISPLNINILSPRVEAMINNFKNGSFLLAYNALPALKVPCSIVSDKEFLLVEKIKSLRNNDFQRTNMIITFAEYFDPFDDDLVFELYTDGEPSGLIFEKPTMRKYNFKAEKDYLVNEILACDKELLSVLLGSGMVDPSLIHEYILLIFSDLGWDYDDLLENYPKRVLDELKECINVNPLQICVIDKLTWLVFGSKVTCLSLLNEAINDDLDPVIYNLEYP